MLSDTIKKLILSADAKALATYDKSSVNVVPLSSVKIINDTIRLIDYFMWKTSKNLQENKNVSLSCRKCKEMVWYQIKWKAEYITSWTLYKQAYDWVHPIFPERDINALIIIHPEEIYDIAPWKNTEEILNSTII